MPARYENSSDSRIEQSDSQPLPGTKSLLVGFALLGLQPVPVAFLASAGWTSPNAVFIRFSFSTLFILGICAVRRRFLRTKNWRLLLARGVLGGTAVLLYFYSISHAGAARGTLLNYTYPIWANLLAQGHGQRASKSFWLGLVGATLGVALLVLPSVSFGEDGAGLGELAGLASGLLAGAAVLTIKKLRETDESMTIVMGFSIVGAVLSFPFVNFAQISQGLSTPSTLEAALCVAVLAFLGHLFFTSGYRGTSIQRGTLLSLFVPLIAAICGVFVLNEPFSWHFALGASLIGGSLLFSVRKT